MQHFVFINSNLPENILDEKGKVKIYKEVHVCALDLKDAKNKLKNNLHKESNPEDWNLQKSFNLSKDWH